MSTATFEPSARGVGTDPHQMVFGLQHLCIEALNEVIESALRRTDDFLFDRAQVGADGVELTALRDLLGERIRPPSQAAHMPISREVARRLGIMQEMPTVIQGGKV